MREISFFSYVNFGDNFEQLNYLRKLVAQNSDLKVFQYIKPEVLPQMYEVVEDVPQIVIEHVDKRPANAINSWLACDSFVHKFPGKNAEHVKYMLAWFNYLSGKAGVTCPITKLEDLLFDYPALLKPTLLDGQFDVLLINSSPQSGQFRGYNAGQFAALAKELAAKNRVVTTDKVEGLPCTRDHNLSLTQIGAMSRSVKNIIGTANGPLWPTLNIWNHERLNLRVMMVDNEHLRYDSRSHTTNDYNRVRQLAKENGLL